MSGSRSSRLTQPTTRRQPEQAVSGRRDGWRQGRAARREGRRATRLRRARRPPPSSRRASILAGTFGSAQARACIGGDKLDALPQGSGVDRRILRTRELGRFGERRKDDPSALRPGRIRILPRLFRPGRQRILPQAVAPSGRLSPTEESRLQICRAQWAEWLICSAPRPSGRTSAARSSAGDANAATAPPASLFAPSPGEIWAQRRRELKSAGSQLDAACGFGSGSANPSARAFSHPPSADDVIAPTPRSRFFPLASRFFSQRTAGVSTRPVGVMDYPPARFRSRM